MKSKLTLRLDAGVKERAKRLAERRGTSVSKIVEDYFRILLREAPGTGSGMNPVQSENSDKVTSLEAEELNTVPAVLPPRTRRMLQEVGPVNEPLDLDEDTRDWIDAASEKHA